MMLSDHPAYIAGREGFFAETGCPYDPNQAEWEIWWDGWREAEYDTDADHP